MQTPLFSLVIPIYNVAPYLDMCLDSLRAQSEGSWEGICVDDGSTDESGERLLHHLREEPRLRAIFHPNHGLSGARNRALPRVTGAYVGFLDSDDAVAPWWLEEAHAYFRKTHADLIRFDMRLWRREALPPLQPSPRYTLLTEREALLQWGWKTFTHAAFCWRYFITQALAKQVCFPSEQRVKEDCIYGLRLLPYLTSVCDCASAPYAYRMRKTSLLHTFSPIEVPIQILDAVSTFLAESMPPAVRNAQRRALAHLACQALTDWATHANPADRARYREVRHAFNRLMAEGCLRFKEIFPWHWRISVWIFLSWGILLPMRLHSFAYRLFLRVIH